jgi:uncharacterized protein
MIINVTVSPKASRNELTKLSDTIFKAKVTAPPEKGKANAKVIELLSKHFKTAKSNITIKAGSTSKEKLFEIK